MPFRAASIDEPLPTLSFSSLALPRPSAHAAAWPSPSRRFLVLYRGAGPLAAINDVSLLWYVYKDEKHIKKKNKSKKSFQANQRGVATIIRAKAPGQSSVAECSFFVSDANSAVSPAVKKKVGI